MITLSDLLQNHHVTYSDGNFQIMGIRACFTSLDAYLELHDALRQSGNERLLYAACKKAGYEWYQKMAAAYPGLKQEEACHWGINLMALAGLGTPAIQKLDLDAKKAIVTLENSPLTRRLPQTTLPVDHFCRGLIAGGLSYILKTDLDAIETTCASLQGGTCTFAIARRNQFTLPPDVLDPQLPPIPADQNV